MCKVWSLTLITRFLPVYTALRTEAVYRAINKKPLTYLLQVTANAEGKSRHSMTYTIRDEAGEMSVY